jgi:hypothetical protein
MALIRHGCTVDVLCPPGHPLLLVPGVRARWRYRRLASLASLTQALLGSQNHDLLIPCDDGVVAQICELHQAQPALGPLIERFLGTSAFFPQFTGRDRFLSLAQGLGLPVARSQRVGHVEDLVDWFGGNRRASVLKQDMTSGGHGVRMVDSLSEATRSLADMARPMGWASLARELLVERDPLAWWSSRQGHRRSFTVQEFIDGTPCNSLMVCWQGEVRAMVSVVSVETCGPTGHATVIRRFEHPVLEHVARTLAAHMGLNGMYGLDYTLQRGTGRPFLIEFNPRCTQFGHIEWAGQGSLAGALARMLGAPEGAVPQLAAGVQTIALFPQKSTLLPAAGGVAADHLDVPQDQPQLVAELLRKPWPHRQWVSRAYLRLRPGQSAPFVWHDDLAS